MKHWPIFAAMLVAASGYALQGRPGLPGSPATDRPTGDKSDVPEALRKSFASSMNSEGQWLLLADALLRSGHARSAVSILNEGSKRASFNPDIWVGLGQALFQHAGNQMNPAAQFAFEKAASLNPDLPGPAYFRGLALVEAGQLVEAEKIWTGLLQKAPKNAEWRPDLVKQIEQLNYRLSQD